MKRIHRYEMDTQCRIGAAVMGVKGYTYEDILRLYFRGAELRKVY